MVTLRVPPFAGSTVPPWMVIPANDPRPGPVPAPEPVPVAEPVPVPARTPTALPRPTLLPFPPLPAPDRASPASAAPAPLAAATSRSPLRSPAAALVELLPVPTAAAREAPCVDAP